MIYFMTIKGNIENLLGIGIQKKWNTPFTSVNGERVILKPITDSFLT